MSNWRTEWVKCGDCGRSYRTIKSMQTHRRAVHSTVAYFVRYQRGLGPLEAAPVVRPPPPASTMPMDQRNFLAERLLRAAGLRAAVVIVEPPQGQDE